MPSPDEGAGARSARPSIGDSGVAVAGRARVDEIQRARLLAAMVEVSSEHGLADASVARVVAHARVSRRTFYELFDDREECFLAVLDEAVAQARRCVLDAYDSSGGWAARIRSVLAALLQFFDAERAVCRLLVIESLGAGEGALERRQRVLAQAIAAVDEGRSETEGGSRLSPLTAEAVVGGALAVIQARIADGAQGSLIELVGPLMSMIVLPYLGPDAALEELKRPVFESRARLEPSAGDPLRELGMRLTYRTVRVLTSVAATPGASNREIGEAASITDQGQASKLLGRLERIGLVRNTGLAPGKGMPNAWTLTAKGARVERAMSADTSRNSVAVTGEGRR